MMLSERLATGRIPWGVIDVDFSKAFIFNRYEGWRPGLGLYTNDKMIKNMSIGGYAGYGTKDYQWKYSGEAQYIFSKKHEFTVKAKYQDNFIETGKHGFKFRMPNSYNTRALLGYQFDRVQEAIAEVAFRAWRYTKWNIGLTSGRTTPIYEYAFNNGDKTYTRYDNTELTISMKFAFKERIVGGFGQNISMGTTYPTIYVYYAHGIKGVFNADFEYNKIEAAIEQTFLIKNVGRTSYRFEGGYIDRALPYGMLFTGEGSYDKKYPLIIRNTFQTVMPYEFLQDRYVHLYTSHNFGGLLFKTDWFQPQLVMHNNFGWSDLKHNTGHSGITFKTKDKLFSETGLQIDNILKVNYLNVGYLNFGAGVFYRYGGYAHDNSSANTVFKLTVSFSIK